MDISKLSSMFAQDDIEYRAQTGGISAQGKPWVLAVPYVTNRAIQQRLDDVCTPACWKNEYMPAPTGAGVLCGISILISGEWVAKWDGAENTNIEPIKGGLSNSMKRAAVQWGIGRYLYQLETSFSPNCREVPTRFSADNNCHVVKKKGTPDRYIDWVNPTLPMWANPATDDKPFSVAIAKASDISELEKAFANAWNFAKALNNAQYKNMFETAYKKHKNTLTEDAARNVEQNLAEVRQWLTKQIDALKLVPNVTAVQSLHKVQRKDLGEKIKGQLFDATELVKILDDAVNDRISQLKVT